MELYKINCDTVIAKSVKQLGRGKVKNKSKSSMAHEEHDDEGVLQQYECMSIPAVRKAAGKLGIRPHYSGLRGFGFQPTLEDIEAVKSPQLKHDILLNAKLHNDTLKAIAPDGMHVFMVRNVSIIILIISYDKLKIPKFISILGTMENAVDNPRRLTKSIPKEMLRVEV